MENLTPPNQIEYSKKHSKLGIVSLIFLILFVLDIIFIFSLNPFAKGIVSIGFVDNFWKFEISLYLFFILAIFSIIFGFLGSKDKTKNVKFAEISLKLTITLFIVSILGFIVSMLSPG